PYTTLFRSIGLTLRNCITIIPAIIAFMISPGKNTVAPSNAAQIEVCVIKAITGAPIKLIRKTPKTILIREIFQALRLSQTPSVHRPMKYAATGQLRINPAEGPTNAENPPLPPVKRGAPNATNKMNSNILIDPVFLPKNPPANITPNVCAVIGTGINPSGIGGIIPNTPTKAANNAAYTISFVDTFTLPLHLTLYNNIISLFLHNVNQ